MVALDPDALRVRGRALAATGAWFSSQAYVEMPTPGRVPSGAMEPYLYPLAAGALQLRTSPEFALKKVLASGIGRIYEIASCWRGREMGPWHAEEFLMLEWYRAGASLEDVMHEFILWVQHLCDALTIEPIAWSAHTVHELVLKHTGLDLSCASALELSGHEEPWDDAFHRCWVERIEPNLNGGVLVYEWPASQAALARTRRGRHGDVALRCEAYVNGHEVANCFDELTSPTTLLRRWNENNALRAANGDAPHPIDEALLEATGRLPKCAGIAVGFERLLAVLCGWDNLHRGQVGL